MRLIIVFDLILKQKYVKQYKQLKYNPKMSTKHQINLTKFSKRTKSTYFKRWRTKL